MLFKYGTSPPTKCVDIDEIRIDKVKKSVINKKAPGPEGIPATKE